MADSTLRVCGFGGFLSAGSWRAPVFQCPCCVPATSQTSPPNLANPQRPGAGIQHCSVGRLAPHRGIDVRSSALVPNEGSER